MSQVHIRKIPIRHVSHLHRLFSSALTTDFDYFSKEYIKGVLNNNNLLKMYVGSINPSRLYIGLYHNQKLAGYSLSGIQTNKKGFLYWMFVHPELRGQKLGKRLLLDTESNLKHRGVDSLSLVTHNQHKFYERQDYVMDKILTEIGSGVDMYAMRKQLV